MKCNCCNLVSDDYNLFCKDSTRISGFKNWCRDCYNKKSRERSNNLKINNPDLYYDKIKKRYHKDKKNGNIQRRKFQNLFKARAHEIMHGIVNKHRVSKIEVDFDVFNSKYFENILLNLKKCPCCNVEFEYGKNYKNNNSPSVDRLDNAKGYIKDNVSIICWRCNSLKSDASIQELEQIVKWLKSKN